MASPLDKATTQELEADLDANLDYEEVGSVEKARRVVTLVNQLLARLRSSAGHGGSSFSRDLNQLKELRDDARMWVRLQAPASRPRTRTIFHQPSSCFRG